MRTIIFISTDLKSSYEINWSIKKGDILEQSDSLLANGGTFLMWNENYAQLRRDFESLAKYEAIIYK